MKVRALPRAQFGSATMRDTVLILRSAIIGTVLLIAFPLMAQADNGSGLGETPLLEAFLDDTLYVVDQPIMLIVRLQNLDPLRAVAVPPMRTMDGYVRVLLSRNGAALSHTIHSSDDGMKWSQARLQLPAGGVQLEVINLLFLFGAMRARGFHPVQASFGQSRLSPGEYELAVEMDWPKEGGQPAFTVLRSATQTFSVRGRSSVPQDSLLLERLVVECKFPELPAYVTMDAQRIRRCCRDHLFGFRQSRYLTLVYYAAGLSDTTLSRDSLMDSLHVANVSPERQAAILWLECKLSRQNRDERLLWLESNDGVWRHGINAQVLQTWRERLVQRRFDPAHED